MRTTKATRERLQRFDAAKLVDVRMYVGAKGKRTERVTVQYVDGKKEPMALSRLASFEWRARRLVITGLKWPVRTHQSLSALVAEAKQRVQTDPDVARRAGGAHKRALARDARKALSTAKTALAKAMPAALRAEMEREEVIAAIDVGRVYDEAIVEEVHSF